MRSGDIQDWPALCARLAAGETQAEGVDARLWASMPPDARAAVQRGAGGAVLATEDKATLVAALNAILERRSFYREQDFRGVEVHAEAKALLARGIDSLSEGTVRRLNRVLLEGVFPTVVAKSRKLDPYEIVAAFRQGPFWMLLAFLCYNCCIMLTANRWRMLLIAQGLRPRRLECIAMNYIGLFFSTFLPGATGGDVVKAYYVARDSDKKAEAVTTVFLDRVFGLYCMISYSVVAILLRFRHLWNSGGDVVALGLKQSQFLVLLVFAVFLTATLGLAVVLSPHWRRLTHFVLDRLPLVGPTLKRVYEAVYLYRSQRRVLAKFVAYSVVAHSLGATSMLFMGLALGDPVAHGGTRALNYYFLIPLGLVINGLPITPAGLGAFEAAAEWLFKTVGSPMGANVAALGHIVFIATNQIGLVFYLKGKRRVAEAARQAAPRQGEAPDPPAGVPPSASGAQSA